MNTTSKTVENWSKATSKIVSQATSRVSEMLPVPLKETLFLRTFGFLKVPVIFYVGPRVIEATESKVVIRIPLNRRTKNHMNCMYFGVLAVGADCAGGLVAMRQIHELGDRVSLLFKDIQGEFLKRAEGDVHFTCEDGLSVRDLVNKATETGERQNMPVTIVATVPSKLGSEPVAKFTLTLSIKLKK